MSRIILQFVIVLSGTILSGKVVSGIILQFVIVLSGTILSGKVVSAIILQLLTFFLGMVCPDMSKNKRNSYDFFGAFYKMPTLMA